MRTQSGLFLAAALTLAGCSQEYEAVTATGRSYDAIRFTRTVQERDNRFNVYTFQAGSVLVSDRRTSWGALYCGDSQAEGSSAVPVCIGVESTSTLVFDPGSWLFETRIMLPANTFERITVNQ